MEIMTALYWTREVTVPFREIIFVGLFGMVGGFVIGLLVSR